MSTSLVLFRFSSLAGLRAVMAFAIGLLAVVGSMTAVQAKDDAAVKFMRRAAAALINAQKKGSAGAFERVVKRYGHVPAIGMYALGNYRRGLRHKQRSSYYRGLGRFIGRYAAKESPKYPVHRVKFAPSAVRDGRSILVDSQIILKDGSTYDVRWMLVPNRKTFKVRDAQVLGFWVTPFLQRLFENYISENGGRVGSLVMALNR
jgi:phospholipid transport system substrate-binding protein